MPSVAARQLVFLAPGPDLQAVLLYFACLRARLPVCLAEPQAEPLARLTRIYRPAAAAAPPIRSRPPRATPPAGPRCRATPRRAAGVTRARPSPTRTWPSCSPPRARPEAQSWSDSPRATSRPTRAPSPSTWRSAPSERAVQSLPMYYSYGLSVLNSHLVAGGTVVLTPHSFMRPEFWRDVDEQRATSFAGVPYMYETLHRLRFDPARHPSLRTLTQAGGALRRELVAHFHDRCVAAGARLVVMYGQTEATARISYVPPERLAEKAGSIGAADSRRPAPPRAARGDGRRRRRAGLRGSERHDGLRRVTGRPGARRRAAGRAAHRRSRHGRRGRLLHGRRAGSSASPSCSAAA